MSELCKYDTTFLTIGSSRVCSHNMTPALNTGVSISSVSVTDVTDDGEASGDLSILSVQVNSASYTEDSTQDTVAIGKAAQWQISTSSTESKLYKLKINIATDATPSDTIVDYVYIQFSEG